MLSKMSHFQYSGLFSCETVIILSSCFSPLIWKKINLLRQWDNFLQKWRKKRRVGDACYFSTYLTVSPNLFFWKPTHLPLSYMHACMLSHVWLFATPWTVAHKAPLSMGFSRPEYWSGLPFPTVGLPDPGIRPASPELAGGFFTTEPPGKPPLP